MARKEVIESIRGCLDKRDHIRNISVIAHVDHGKSTLTDSLIVAAGLMSKGRRGDRFMDIRDDEKKRGITIKSTSVSMVFDVFPPKVKVLPKKGQWKKEKEKEKIVATATATATVAVFDIDIDIDIDIGCVFITNLL